MTKLSKQASKIMKKMDMGLNYIVVHLTLFCVFHIPTRSGCRTKITNCHYDTIPQHM